MCFAKKCMRTRQKLNTQQRNNVQRTIDILTRSSEMNIETHTEYFLLNVSVCMYVLTTQNVMTVGPMHTEMWWVTALIIPAVLPQRVHDSASEILSHSKGRVRLNACLDGYGEPRPHLGSNPRPSSLYRVAIPTTLSWLSYTGCKGKFRPGTDHGSPEEGEGGGSRVR